ncbi:MAG: energy-coupling factor transporter transmembrane protein EcfT [Treponema sp.]|nr:energy-coupling factor transporter transmembrane protein EcfT [Treponema sp.]
MADVKRDHITAAGDDVKRERITADGGITHARCAAESRANSAVTVPRRRRRGGGESFRAISLGQFLDRPSSLRSLRAGVKLPLLFAVGLAAIAGPHHLFPLGVLAGVLAAGRAAGRVGPFILLGGLRSAAPYLAFIIFVQTAFTWSGDTSGIVFKLGFYSITRGELSRSLSLVLRLLALMSSLTLYGAVTPLRETLRALTRFLKPLSRIGIPGGDIAMTIAIALRFVPVLTGEARRITAAQLSRGGGSDFPGPARLRAAAGVLLPLFLRALERSERLAEAMILRCYQSGAAPTTEGKAAPE